MGRWIVSLMGDDEAMVLRSPMTPQWRRPYSHATGLHITHAEAYAHLALGTDFRWVGGRLTSTPPPIRARTCGLRTIVRP